jgi:hypothetical protein
MPDHTLAAVALVLFAAATALSMSAASAAWGLTLAGAFSSGDRGVRRAGWSLREREPAPAGIWALLSSVSDG